MPKELGETSSEPLCSTSLSGPTKPPPSLLDLPPEIQLLIFDVLQAKDDPTTSACLGLTCKRFYPLFRARFTKAPLEKSCCKGSLRGVDHRGKWYYGSVCAECASGRNDLYELLRDWMPRDLAYRAGLCTGKFIAEEKLKILVAKRLTTYRLLGMAHYAGASGIKGNLF